MKPAVLKLHDHELTVEEESRRVDEIIIERELKGDEWHHAFAQMIDEQCLFKVNKEARGG